MQKTKMETILNRKVFEELQIGDLVEFRRMFYSHWGVYVGTACQSLHIWIRALDIGILVSGNGNIIHLTAKFTDTFSGSSSRNGKNACVSMDNFWDIVEDGIARINNKIDKHCLPYHPQEIVARAMSKLGPVQYKFFSQNCEHFAAWCRNGIQKSKQADKARTVLSVGAIIGSVVVIAGVICEVVEGITKKDD